MAAGYYTRFCYSSDEVRPRWRGVAADADPFAWGLYKADVAGRLLGGMVTWDDAFLAGPLIVVANCLPITPGGIGLAEAASSELFAHLGSAGRAEMMVLTRICGALASLPGILPLLASTGCRQEPVSDAPAAPPATSAIFSLKGSS